MEERNYSLLLKKIEELEKEIKERKIKEREFFDNLKDLVIIMNAQGKIVFVNKSVKTILGYNKEEILGKRLEDFLTDHSFNKEFGEIQKQIHEGKDGFLFECEFWAKDFKIEKRISEKGLAETQTFEGLVEFFGKDRRKSKVVPEHIKERRKKDIGRRVQLEISESVIWEGNRIIAIQCIARDITERKRLEEKARESEKNQALVEMAGATAHELNQPLTIILATIEILKKNKHESLKDIEKELELIYRSSERMAMIIKKISKITHYETKPYVSGANIIDIERSSDG